MDFFGIGKAASTAIVAALVIAALAGAYTYWSHEIAAAERARIETEFLKERVKNMRERKDTHDHVDKLPRSTLERCAAGELHLCAPNR